VTRPGVPPILLRGKEVVMKTWIRACLVTSGVALTSVPPLTPPSLAAPAIRVRDARIAAFAGTWVGENNPSPVGPIDFAMDFRRQADGSLRSHSALSKETWIDLHFRKDSDGWVLHESAGLAGLGEQAYPLHPVRSAGDTLEWAYLKEPGYLTARTAVSEHELYMQVLVRGSQHALFRLRRVTGEAAAAVRTQLEQARERPAGGDLAILETAGGGEDPIEVRNARAKALALPREAAAHVELGDAIAAVIQDAPPAKLPPYAQEMVGAYRKAVELDSANVAAHFGLSQYYLHAPPIAGGSLERGESEAAILARLGSPLGDVVKAQVEIKRGQRAAARERLVKVVDENPDLALARRLLLSLAENETQPDGK
jgi:hypothetical protein